MKAKTFSELSVNDIIYRIKKNGSLLDNKDQYGNNYASELLSEIVVKSICLGDNNCVQINKNSGYTGRSYCDLVLPDGAHLYLIVESIEELQAFEKCIASYEPNY